MINFIDRLASEIERLGGVSKVASKLDVARNTIYNWMAKGNVPLNDLMRLESIGMNVGYVMGNAESVHGLTAEQEQAGYSVEVLSKEEQALLDNYRHSPEVGKRAVEAAVAAVAEQKPRRKLKM